MVKLIIGLVAQTIFSYNLSWEEIEDLDFGALYQKRRRDSIFAGVFKCGETIYAMRDHIGVIPLFYCVTNNHEYIFSSVLSDLLPYLVDKTINLDGLRAYLGLGTTKLAPLLNDIVVIPPGSVISIGPKGETKTVFQYRIEPRPLSVFTKLKNLRLEFERLLLCALVKQLKSSTVGLFLSGGIDSSLIGLGLKKLGIEINSYSSAPQNNNNGELRFIECNINHIKPCKIYIDRIAGEYHKLSEAIPKLYRSPHGSSSAMAVTSLWQKTPVRLEKQIFFGQNCDVITNAMDNRYFDVFSKTLFRLRRQKWGASAVDDMFDLYLQRHTRNMLQSTPFSLRNICNAEILNNFQMIAVAGMYLGRTPLDSETITGPAIANNLLIGNPYYDMDLIEFLLGLRLNHKLVASKNNNLVTLDKKIIRQAALINGLPQELVYRKKGFTVPRGTMDSNDGRLEFFSNLPNRFAEIYCQDEQRFAADSLNKFMQSVTSI